MRILSRDMIAAVVSPVVGLLLAVYVQPLIATTSAPRSPQPGGPTASVPSPPSIGSDDDVTDGGVDDDAAALSLSGIQLVDVAITEGGKRVELRIAVLDAEHYWPLGRADTIVGPGGREEDVLAFFNSSGLQRRIAEAEDIIAIGMASCEDDERSEEARAQDRSHELIRWARQFESLQKSARLYAVNLGQYRDPGCGRKSAEQTRYQRNALLVAIMSKQNIDSLAELEQLLKKHLMKKDGLALDIDRYSRPDFVLNRRD